MEFMRMIIIAGKMKKIKQKRCIFAWIMEFIINSG